MRKLKKKIFDTYRVAISTNKYSQGLEKEKERIKFLLVAYYFAS